MSFFDELETTVADMRIINAMSSETKIVLDLKPLAELASLEAKLRADFKIGLVMEIETCCRFLFAKHLREHHYGSFVDFMDSLVPFQKGSGTKRATIATQIESDHLRSIPAVRRSSAVSSRRSSGEIPGQPSEDTGSQPPAGSIGPKDVHLGTWLSKEHPDELTAVMNQLKEAPADLFEPILKAVEAHFSGVMMRTFMESEHFHQYVQLSDYAKTKLTLDSFKVFRVLGRGAFGAVSAVQKTDTTRMYAMKAMNKKMVKKGECEWMTNNEQEILRMMNSVFVLKLDFSFHNNDSLFLLFQMLSGGDLKFHLREAREDKKAGFSMERACFYTAETLLGLDHMHSHNIVYRDLKPDNVLLASSGHVVISDLGLAIKLREDKLNTSIAGTPGYWAPEIVAKTGTYKQADYWSLGVMLHEMVCGKRPVVKVDYKKKEWSPYNQEGKTEEMALEKDGVFKPLTEFSEKFTPDCKDLLLKLFEPDPHKRIGAGGVQEIKDHPFFSKYDWDAMEKLELTPPYKPDEMTIHAESIAEVGNIDKGKLKKVNINAEDNAHYADFEFTDEHAIQVGLYEALIKIDEQAAEELDNASRGKDAEDSGGGGGCCVIL